VVVGGGFGGLKVARRLARADVEITLIDRVNHHLFQPLLYQVGTGILAGGQIAPRCATSSPLARTSASCWPRSRRSTSRREPSRPRRSAS
jgi:NADH dehydrogenase FAD-containing subunit